MAAPTTPHVPLTFNNFGVEWLPKPEVLAAIARMCGRYSINEVTIEDMSKIAVVVGAHLHGANVAPSVEVVTPNVEARLL